MSREGQLILRTKCRCGIYYEDRYLSAGYMIVTRTYPEIPNEIGGLGPATKPSAEGRSCPLPGVTRGSKEAR